MLEILIADPSQELSIQNHNMRIVAVEINHFMKFLFDSLFLISNNSAAIL